MNDFFNRLRQLFSGANGIRYYGDGGTIHPNTEVNVELDKDGKVVSVWFRCCPLPFTQTIVSDTRANEMVGMYKENNIVELHGIEVKDVIKNDL